MQDDKKLLHIGLVIVAAFALLLGVLIISQPESKRRRTTQPDSSKPPVDPRTQAPIAELQKVGKFCKVEDWEELLGPATDRREGDTPGSWMLLFREEGLVVMLDHKAVRVDIDQDVYEGKIWGLDFPADYETVRDAWGPAYKDQERYAEGRRLVVYVFSGYQVTLSFSSDEEIAPLDESFGPVVVEFKRG